MVGDEGLASSEARYDALLLEFLWNKMVGDEGLEPPTFSV